MAVITKKALLKAAEAECWGLGPAVPLRELPQTQPIHYVHPFQSLPQTVWGLSLCFSPPTSGKCLNYTGQVARKFGRDGITRYGGKAF